MNSKSHNGIKVAILSLLLMISAPTMVPHKAHAFLGGLLGGVTVKEFVLDPIAFGVNKAALQSLAKSTINWVNSGFNGSPSFVQDISKAFLQTGDAEAQNFVNDFLNNGTLSNNPFREQVGQQVLANYFRNTSNDSFSLNNQFTLDQVSSDPQAFINGDYTKGGLDAWMSLVLNPGNNPLALFQTASNELNNRVSGKQGQLRDELNRNQGFLSFRGNCAGANRSTGFGAISPDNGPIAVSGTNASATNLNTSPSITSGNTNASASSGGGTNLGGSLTSNGATNLGVTSDPLCLGNPVLTPGTLISHALNTFAADIGAQSYIANDEISELIGSLFGGLITNALGGGGLTGISQPTAGGGTSVINRATNPAAVTSTQGSLNSTNDFITTLSDQQAVLQDYQVKVDGILAAAQAAKTALGTTTCAKVDATIAQMQTKKANAATSVNKLDSIRSQLITSVTQDSANQDQYISTATTQYQQLQADPTFPTAGDIAVADNGSLLKQMQAIAATGVCQ